METKPIVLIADDYDLGRKELGEIVVRYGFDVVFAVNGKEAVDMCLSAQKIDVVLMDGNMPLMKGDTATKLIKKQYPKIIIIAITSNDIECTYREIGYDGYVRKPLLSPVIKNLFSLIDTLLSKVL